MPNEIVWVDKVINPRSVVLTHSEAMTILKNAKNNSGRPQRKAESCSSLALPSTLKLKDQKSKCLEFLMKRAEEREIMPVVEMQEELKAIEASKTIYKQAVENGVIKPPGFPFLKPSELLKKGILKKQKERNKDSAALRLSTVSSSAINKSAIKDLLDDGEDDVLVLSPSANDDSTESNEDETVVTKKRRRIVISDDEDVTENPSESSAIPIAIEKFSEHDPEPLDPSPWALQTANDPDKFRKALNECLEASANSPLTITFEADSDMKVHVIASTTKVYEDLHNPQTPTNLMFTNAAVSPSFNDAVRDEINLEDAFRSQWFGNSKTLPGTIALSNEPSTSKVSSIGKIPYSDFMKDKKFRAKLLSIPRPEVDITPYLGIVNKQDDDEDDASPLPSLSFLSSIYNAKDLELKQFKADQEKLNSSRMREKQRIQHSVVNVPVPSKPEIVVGYPQNISVSSQSNTITYGLKSILKKPINDEELSTVTEMKKKLIAHNTVIHEAINYLSKSKATQKGSAEVKEAYDKLSKYPLTFLEKYNFITTMPKDLPGMLCMLDDLGLRLSKETMDEMEKDVLELSKKVAKNVVQDSLNVESAEEASDRETGGRKKVKFNKCVQVHAIKKLSL